MDYSRYSIDIRIMDESPEPLSEIARKLGRSKNTVRRWAKEHSPRLDVVFIASVCHTSLEAYRRWVEACNQT